MRNKMCQCEAESRVHSTEGGVMSVTSRIICTIFKLAKIQLLHILPRHL